MYFLDQKKIGLFNDRKANYGFRLEKFKFILYLKNVSTPSLTINKKVTKKMGHSVHIT